MTPVEYILTLIVGPATHRGPRVPARCRGQPQRAHSASLPPRLSGLRLRLLRPRFAQVPSALIVSDRGKGAVLQVQCPGRLTSVL
jgi:hypothetical protein